ncbi:hypothetical protein AB0C81_12315 [Streptomyces roseoverticillatus]|uniref:hypothetical protein n=1 Tax=Streptomyces roseoverticillatus TaxID=66429 RepID=UPI0033D7423A
MNISETEFRKAYKPGYALLSDARPAVAALVEALEKKAGEVPPAEVDGRDYEARHITHLTGQIHPGQLAQKIGRMLRRTAFCSPMRALTWDGSGITWSWKRNRTSARQVRSDRWPDTSTAPSD